MKFLKTASVALAATLTVSGMLALTLPAQAEVTFESMLEENGGDIPRDHWAANAIQALVDKYGVMSGYPDKTFRGTRNLTRYEMAAALYQVMQYIEKNKPDGDKTDTSGFATKADLEAVAALQMEFKKELEKTKKDHNDLAEKVETLERVRVHGGVEVLYRDRVSVANGTEATSPLFSAANTTPATEAAKTPPVTTLAVNNNVGDSVRNANGTPTVFNNPSSARLTVDDSNPFRVRSHLAVNAMLTDGMMARTWFDLHEAGVPGGGHDASEGGPLTVREIYLDLGGKDDAGMGTNFKVGFVNMGNSANPGTRLMNHFGNSQWMGHSYGMVGWGGSQKKLSPSDTAVRNSASRYWVGGINASNVDPDSMAYNMVSSPTAALDTSWGWGKFVVGLNYGSTMTDRGLASGGNLSGLYSGDDGTTMGEGSAAVDGTDAALTADVADSTATPKAKQTRALFGGAKVQGLDRVAQANGTRLSSGLLPLPSQYGDGYGLVGFELDLLKESFPVRLGVHAMSYLNDNMLDFSNPSRKEISGVLDLGWDKGFGLTLQVNKSFIGYDKHSLGLMFNDLGGSGFDVGLGVNLATRGLFNISSVASGSAGLYLGIPFVNMGEGKDNLELVLAARQSLGDTLGNTGATGATADLTTLPGSKMFKDSGLTVSLPYMNVGGTPLNLRAEYSLLLANELWSLQPLAHDVSVMTSYWF